MLRYICYAVSLYYFYLSDRTLEDLVRASIVCFMTYFTFGYGVHENHACVVAVLGVCWLAMDGTRLVEAVVLSVLFNMNLLLFYGLSGSGLNFSRNCWGGRHAVFRGVRASCIFGAVDANR